MVRYLLLNMRLKVFILVISWLFAACTSSRLVDSWKEEGKGSRIDKVLVIGISANEKVREKYEAGLARALQKEKVKAVASIQDFEPYFINNQTSESELRELEKELQAQGFDGVLLTKVKRIEDYLDMGSNYQEMQATFSDFKEDYYRSQLAYGEKGKRKKVVRTETALYSLQPGNRHLIWKGTIDIVNPQSNRGAIRLYINLLTATLKTENILPSS